MSKEELSLLLNHIPKGLVHGGKATGECFTLEGDLSSPGVGGRGGGAGSASAAAGSAAATATTTTTTAAAGSAAAAAAVSDGGVAQARSREMSHERTVSTDRALSTDEESVGRMLSMSPPRAGSGHMASVMAAAGAAEGEVDAEAAASTVTANDELGDVDMYTNSELVEQVAVCTCTTYAPYWCHMSYVSNVHVTLCCVHDTDTDADTDTNADTDTGTTNTDATSNPTYTDTYTSNPTYTYTSTTFPCI